MAVDTPRKAVTVPLPGGTIEDALIPPGVARDSEVSAAYEAAIQRANHTGTQPASTVTNTPAGNISATTVQAAINELDADKVSLSEVGSGANQIPRLDANGDLVGPIIGRMMLATDNVVPSLGEQCTLVDSLTAPTVIEYRLGDGVTVRGVVAAGAYFTKVGTAYIGGDQTGNARGAYATDVQSRHILATEVASGQASSAVGYRNTASGLYSSAVGHRNAASGTYSSAFGYRNAASGTYSSAFGYYNAASGDASSAFGYNNTASSYASSAVGYRSTASGTYSSAIGKGNIASGYRSSAVGYNNTASELNSSAFGHNNTASGQNSSAVGYSNTVSGYYSSAVGYNNTASGFYSSAVGYDNIASGFYSSAFGHNNTASGQNSSAFGYFNTASGQGSSAVGYSNIASGVYSSAFGYSNIVGIARVACFGYNSSRVYGPQCGYIRIHGQTGMVVSTVQDRATEYLDAERTETVTITRSGSVATATLNNHGYNIGSKVVISGATQAAYNGTKTITDVTTNTYSFDVTGTPATPATGTILASASPGSERDNDIARGTFAIRRNGLQFILDYNDAGTVKNLVLGTVT